MQSLKKIGSVEVGEKLITKFDQDRQRYQVKIKPCKNEEILHLNKRARALIKYA